MCQRESIENGEASNIHIHKSWGIYRVTIFSFVTPYERLHT